ncbi:MAG: tight adherence protein [Microbacteriaceae bacterium]|nr:tight adherence protein [Microbacteriaceae bacterium]
MVPMSQLVGWAILCGLVLGVGLWSIANAIPRLSRPNLADRVAPYIVDVSETARSFVARRTVDPLPLFGAFLAPTATRVHRGIASALGGNEAIGRRLRQAGSSATVDAFRGRQLVWLVLGFGAGVVLVVAALAVRPVPLAGQAAIPLVTAACAFVLKDWLLQRSARMRLRRIASEFPTVLEFLTLSLSAGEGILDSLRRIARTSSGELSLELGLVVAEVNTGIPLAQALQRLARGIQLPLLDRCIDAMTGALERGTPLAEVLRAQAQDSRDESKRALIELAGKKEVAMLIPLVFLILPVTVLFAIFPGIFVLQAGF